MECDFFLGVTLGSFFGIVYMILIKSKDIGLWVALVLVFIGGAICSYGVLHEELKLADRVLQYTNPLGKKQVVKVEDIERVEILWRSGGGGRYNYPSIVYLVCFTEKTESG